MEEDDDDDDDDDTTTEFKRSFSTLTRRVFLEKLIVNKNRPLVVISYRRFGENYGSSHSMVKTLFGVLDR
jgi:hypothetical protein